MNKYFVKIPYSYTKFADLSGFVYAEDKEEARELAEENFNIHDESYDDCDDSGDSTYNYSEMSIELEESDIPESEIPSRNITNSFTNSTEPVLPNHYLEDLPTLARL